MLVFEEDVINKYLQCPLCQVRYDEPRTLPCGKTVCNNCLKLMELTKLNENLRQLKCKACNEIHILSKTELATNEFVKVFLDDKVTPKEIYRGKAAESFKTQLKEMKSDLDYFDASNRDKIRSHCEALRREIEKEANNLVEFIELSSNSFLKQIDDYEEECIAEYENKNVKMDEKLQGDFIRDIRDFHEEWLAYLKRIVIDDDEIVRASEMAKQHQQNLHEQKKKLDTFIFNGSVLKYQKNGREPIVEEILGTLSLEPINEEEKKEPAPLQPPQDLNTSKMSSLSNKLAANKSGFLDDQSDYDDIFKNFGATDESNDDDFLQTTSVQPASKPDTSQTAFLKELKEKLDKTRKVKDEEADRSEGVNIKIEADLSKRPSEPGQQQMPAESDWQAQIEELKLQQEQEMKLKKNMEKQQRYLLEKQRQMQQKQPSASQPGLMEIYTEETTNITETETIIENYRTNPINRKDNLQIDDVSVLLNQSQAQPPSQPPQPDARPVSPQPQSQTQQQGHQFSRLPPPYSEPAYQQQAPQVAYGGFGAQSVNPPNNGANGFSRRQSKSMIMDLNADPNARQIPVPAKPVQPSGKSKLPVLSTPNLSAQDPYQQDEEEADPGDALSSHNSSATSKMPNSSSPSKSNLNRRVLNLIRRKNKKGHQDS